MSSQKIKEVALKLFTERGYEGASLADIAEVVGIKKSSIYNHYKNKDDLFLHIFEKSCQEELAIRKLALNSTKFESIEQYLNPFLNVGRNQIISNTSSRFVFRFTMFPPYHFIDVLGEKISAFIADLHKVVYDALRKIPANGHLSDETLMQISSHYILLLKGTFSEQITSQYGDPSNILEPAWIHFSEIVSLKK